MKFIWKTWNIVLESRFWFYGKLLLIIVKSHHGEIHIHGKTWLTRNMILVHNSNFSGME